jgi:hypothetical protein
MKLGQVYSDAGIYLLYTFTDTKQRLVFQTFAPTKQEEDLYDYSIEEKLSSISV